MSQITESVGIVHAGSRTAVDVSRKRFMSDSWIFWKPRMLEPSKPIPSSQIPVSSSSIGIEKCCQMPGKSLNFRSTILMLCFWMSSLMLFGVGKVVPPKSSEYSERSTGLDQTYRFMLARRQRKWLRRLPAIVKFLLQSGVTPLAGPDPHRIRYRNHEDLPVTDRPRS